MLQLAACSPTKAPGDAQANGADAGIQDAADTDGISDAEVISDVAIEDTIDVIADVDAGTDAVADLKDIPQLPDVPPVADAQDTKIDSPDVVPFDFGPCAEKDLIIYADSLPDDSTCTGGCPPGYPCTCGDCPWVQTPLMKKPRYGARAVWTGKEVVVLGGSSTLAIGEPEAWSAERWYPMGKKGFELINTPPIMAPYQPVPPPLRWDGQKVWAVFHHLDKPSDNDYSYTWDPLLDKATPLQWTGRPFTHDAFPAAVWVDGRLFDWGHVPNQPGVAKAVTQNVVALYDPASQTWAPVAFPETLVAREENDVAFGCTVASGEDVFVYHAPVHVLPGSGLDPKKSIHLQYHLPSGVWSVLPQTMPADPGHDPCSGHGFVIGTASGFAVWGRTLTPGGLTPPAAVLYDKASQTWSAMPLPNSNAPANGGGATVLTGQRIVTHSSWYLSAAVYDLGTNAWSYTTQVGFPFSLYPRGAMAMVATDQDLLQLGGINGPAAYNVIHADGVRLPLSSLGATP